MMRTRAELIRFAREAAAMVSRDSEVGQFEIYCASTEHRIARLNFTSDIPCCGLEEMKSVEADGFQIKIAKRRNPHEVGVASGAGALTLEAVGDVLSRAHRAAVIDPFFPGFPKAPRALRLASPRPGGLSRAGDAPLVAAAWSIVRGAAEEFARSAAARTSRPRLVVGGDLTVIRDRIALASSNFAGVRNDEGAHFSSSVAALVESLDAKGTASALGAEVLEMKQAAARLGRDAVRRALSLAGGVRPGSGMYRVVLGPQPVAEILNYMVMGSVTTGAFHAANSAYHERFGAQVMDSRLGLVDDPAMRAGAVRRRITCEGLPTRRIVLVRDGRLVGLLSNFYDTHRLQADENRAEKLGPGANGVAAFEPLSGYRLGEGGGRRYDHSPSSSGTNVVMKSRAGVTDAELLGAVREGIYVGRVWYTYPINGQRAGDFTCTVTGDSYLIRDGKLAEPLAPNCLRINSNIDKVFNRVLAAGRRSHPALVWGAPEAYYVPALAIEEIGFSAVGEPPA